RRIFPRSRGRARPPSMNERGRGFFGWALVALSCAFGSGAAQATAAPEAKPKDASKTSTSASAAPLRPHLEIERITLDNGLRIVLNRDVSSPTVAVVVWYDVGSRNEQPGEGGFAHLFEHIM